MRSHHPELGMGTGDNTECKYKPDLLRARSAAVVSNHTATVAEFSKERTNVANV